MSNNCLYNLGMLSLIWWNLIFATYVSVGLHLNYLDENTTFIKCFFIAQPPIIFFLVYQYNKCVKL